MSDTSSRLLRALRDLGIALINATLILVILCLILGLRLTNRVDDVASNFARNLVSIEPLRNDIQSMTEEISGFRSDLVSIRESSGELTSEAAQALSARLAVFEGRLDQMQGKIETVGDRVNSIEFDPKAMFDHAVKTAADQFVVSAGQLAGCEMPAVDTMKALTTPEGSVSTN